MDYKDYYKILGVDKTSSDDEIRKVYRNLAKKYHPDKNQGDKVSEEKFKEISEAYDVLGNKEKRKKYDEFSSQWNSYQRTGRGNPNDWYKNYSRSDSDSFDFSGDFSDLFGRYNNFSDIFENFMGAKSSGKRQRQTPRKGQDIAADLKITLEEAFNGIEKHFSIDGKKYKVRLDPGIKEGKRLRLSKQGKDGMFNGEKGDLYITIVIEKDNVFERKENDLHASIQIDLYTAILGGKKEFKTLDGKTIMLNISPGTDSGTVLRLKGFGMPYYKEEGRGDLFIKSEIVLPKKLSKTEIELFQKLAKLQK